MNTNTSDTENLIELSLKEGVSAYSPPAGLKKAVSIRVRNEWSRRRPTRKSARKRWLRSSLITAAAASLLVAAVIWVTLGGNGTASAYAELARAVENTKAVEWLHWETQLNLKDMQGKYEAWISINPLQFFKKLPNGVIQHIDEKVLRTYDPAAKTITIEDAPRVTSPEIFQARTFLELFSHQIADAKKHGAKVVKSHEKGLVIYTITRERLTERYTVDAETFRILQMATEGWSHTGEKCVSTWKIDYPKSGPSDIYALGVPRDAKIVDETAAPEVREPSSFQRHFDQAIKALDARAEWPGSPEAVCKAYWEARAAKRFDEMAIFWPGSASFNFKSRLKDEKPTKYVFGKARKLEGALDYMIVVPYASEYHYKRHGKYNIKMHLTNRKSAKGRYYITH